MKLLARLEEELDDVNPALATALSRTPSWLFSAFLPSFPIRHVLVLLGALTSLIAVYTMFAEQLGIIGLARSVSGFVVTLAAAVWLPWLVVPVVERFER